MGAVLVVGGEVIASRGNERERRHDPTAHAEMLVLRDGAGLLGGWRLREATIYVTLEPCAMCAGAMVLARVKTAGVRRRRSQGRSGRHHIQRRRPSSPQPSPSGPGGRDVQGGLRASARVLCRAPRSRSAMSAEPEHAELSNGPAAAPLAHTRQATAGQSGTQPDHHAHAAGRRADRQQPGPHLRCRPQPERCGRPGLEPLGGPPWPADRHAPPHLRLQAGRDPGGILQLGRAHRLSRSTSSSRPSGASSTPQTSTACGSWPSPPEGC